MARGKFNKRGGGPRLDPVNAEEIELRNGRLADLEEQRATRRAEEDDDEDEDEGKDDKEKKKKKEKKEQAAAVAAGVATADAATAAESAAAAVEAKPKGKANVAHGKPKKDLPVVPVTTEADHKNNMVKLAKVRKRREDAEARRLLEEEGEKEKEEMELQRIATSITLQDSDTEDDKKKSKKKSKDKSIPKLDKIAIKKMKPAQMKEALKERGLDIQGNAKALQDRLLKHESER